MNKSAEYIQFEEGFLKQAVEAGCDEAFLRGYLKEADEAVEVFEHVFDKLAEESGDPLFKTKLANDILFFGELLKQADPVPAPAGVPTGASATPGGLGSSIQSLFSKNPQLLSSLMSRGGIGGLLGMIFGVLTGHPILGTMLGGLGGAGYSAYQNWDKYKTFFGDNTANSPQSAADGQKQEAAQTTNQTAQGTNTNQTAQGAATSAQPAHALPPTQPVHNPALPTPMHGRQGAPIAPPAPPQPIPSPVPMHGRQGVTARYK